MIAAKQNHLIRLYLYSADARQTSPGWIGKDIDILIRASLERIVTHVSDFFCKKKEFNILF